MKKIVLILSLFLTITVNLFSQDTNIVKYFPLKVGNIWVYQINNQGSFCSQTLKRRVRVISSIIINSKKYFLFSDTTRVISGGGNCSGGGSIPFDTLRIDSINGNIYKYSYQGCNFLNHEITLDSLKSRLNDKVMIVCGSDTNYKCTDTNSFVIFGQLTQARRFEYYLPPEMAWSRTYSKGIGQSRYWLPWVGGQSNATLIGCVLDGVLYGDTSFLTGINQIGTEIPERFILYQNNPNPFNPATKIRFALPKSSFATLVIYDALGREIETLINKQLNSGTYEADWSADKFSSGVYYYKLVTGDYTETMKMVLMK